MFNSEQGTGAAKASGNFIANKQYLVAVAQLAHGF